jgi:hypothetical protein
MRRATIMRAALVIAASTALLASDAALACRGWRGWSRGDDVSKLRPGEIAVKAKFLASYKSEQRFDTIMGTAYGMIYQVQIVDVAGASAPDDSVKGLSNATIFVHLRPSVCEAYHPGAFKKDAEKVLVLKMGAAGLYDLVGGQES